MIFNFNHFRYGVAEELQPLVLACGCFDLLTIGHIRHLKAARKLGNRLCVLVTGDLYVGKGVGRPIFSESIRAEVLDSLECVDLVVINPHPTAVEAITILRPAIYVKGAEYQYNATPALRKEVDALTAIGGQLEFTETTNLHTTDVLKQILGTPQDLSRTAEDAHKSLKIYKGGDK